MEIILNPENGVHERFFLYNEDILPAYKKVEDGGFWKQRYKKIPVNLKVTIYREEADKNKMMMGSQGLFITIKDGCNFITHDSISMNIDGHSTIKWLTEQGEAYYFKSADWDRCRKVYSMETVCRRIGNNISNNY